MRAAAVGTVQPLWDLGYGVEGGFKYYFGEHGGVIFGLNYTLLDGDSSLSDADDLGLDGGLILKF